MSAAKVQPPNARSVAARVLTAVLGEGQSLSAALPPALDRLEAAAERALVQELCYGALRWHLRLEGFVRRLVRKPLKRKDLDVHCLLLLGLYQLIYLRVPAYAAVAETVNASRSLDKSWAAGLVNAVLRGYQRDRETLTAQVNRDEQAACAHPRWLLDQIRRDWPESWHAIIAANNARAPMTLRVNLRHQAREDYGQQLDQAGIGFHETPFVASGLVLDAPLDVQRLPGFAEGRVSVQDGAAQLAAFLLDAGPGMRVLDACAAPGGKTAHILERWPDLRSLLAVDVDPQRLARVRDNLDRLSLEAELRVGDAGEPPAWWDCRAFDRILLDAPCSATGVLRRHPDIKVLRRPADIDALARQQARILAALWPLLAPGGMLLYVTCSIASSENARQVGRFLQAHTDARERKIEAAWGHTCTHGRQILPGEQEMDGFYYARLEKRG